MVRDTRRLSRWLRVQGPREVFAALAEVAGRSHGPAVAVFAVDGDQRVIYWSEGARELFGWAPEEVVGEHCLKSNRCPQCLEGCGLARTAEIAGAPLTLLDREGRPVEVTKTARAFFDADGAFAGGIEILVPSVPAPEPDDDPAPADEGFHGLLSEDPAMQRIFGLVRSVAETDATVLVRGDSGTGKELVARAIHLESRRRGGPFHAVNCGALSPALLESELFGHLDGAFAGAAGARRGLFQRTHGGTLFLDEVGELSPDLQSRLLRVLQERMVTPVGGSEGIEVDVRVIGATHRSLRRRVEEGTFRQDLMVRLRVVSMSLPPLRERRGDIALLLHHFVAEANRSGQRQVRRVSPEAMRLLLEHGWPGNVRELIDVVQYAFVLGRGPELLASELPPELHAAPMPTGPLLGDEATRVREAIRLSRGNLGEAAALLGVSRATFWRWRKRHGL